MIFPPQRGQDRPRVVRFPRSIFSSRFFSAMFQLRLTFVKFQGRYFPALRLNTMKIEQKIVTGGTNNTNTPMLRFFTNLLLLPPDTAALHIEHCASAGILLKSRIPDATKINATVRQLKYFITAPLRVQVPLVAIPETCSANQTIENYLGRTQKAKRCTLQALAPTSGSN